MLEPADPIMAVVEFTINGEQGVLTDPMNFYAPDAAVRDAVTEVLQGDGQGMTGATPDPHADLSGYVVSRYEAKGQLPYRISLRPKVPFGG